MNNFYKDNDRLKRQMTHPMMKRIVALKEDGYTQSREYRSAPENFDDAIDSYDKVMEVMGEICAGTIAPNAFDVDAEGPHCEGGRVTYASGTQRNHDMLTRSGLYGLTQPRRYDGLNFPTVMFVMASEMVARADAGFCNIWSLQGCVDIIREFGDEELKAEFIPRISRGETCSMDLTEPDAGSDLQSAMLKATWSEERSMWLLNGVKRFITNGDADIKLVLARSESGTTDARGLSCFVYDRNWGGVTVRRIEHKMGIKGSPTCELAFNNAPAKLLGSRGLGLIKYVMSMMNGARLDIGAQSVGIMEAALREAVRYANERKQFGVSIATFPAVYSMLSRMQAKLDGSRALLYETARYVDIAKLLGAKKELSDDERAEMRRASKYADMYTPMLKLMAGEYANQVAYDAVQVYGGSGFIKEFAVERLYRDARVTTLYEGTSQMQVVAAARYTSSGVMLNRIREYEADAAVLDIGVKAKVRLRKMTDEFERMCGAVAEMDAEAKSFHARNLVETGARIIISYLLMMDSKSDDRAALSASVYLDMAEAQNLQAAAEIAAGGGKEQAQSMKQMFLKGSCGCK